MAWESACVGHAAGFRGCIYPVVTSSILSCSSSRSSAALRIMSKTCVLRVVTLIREWGPRPVEWSPLGHICSQQTANTSGFTYILRRSSSAVAWAFCPGAFLWPRLAEAMGKEFVMPLEVACIVSCASSAAAASRGCIAAVASIVDLWFAILSSIVERRFTSSRMHRGCSLLAHT